MSQRDILEAHKSPIPSRWREKANMRRDLKKKKVKIPYIWLCPKEYKIWGYKYIVYGKYGADVTYNFIDAIRYWLWHCGVSPKIAFFNF